MYVKLYSLNRFRILAGERQLGYFMKIFHPLGQRIDMVKSVRFVFIVVVKNIFRKNDNHTNLKTGTG